MDLFILAAIAIAVLAIVAIVVMLRRSWGGSLSAPPPPLSAAQAGGPPAQIAGAGLAEISTLVARGNKIEAIKRVRELTGLGLKEAKDYLESIPLSTAYGLPALAVQPANVDVPGHELAEISTLVARGNKIEAIKRVRELTGLGLKEAKDYVESMPAGGVPPAPPGSQAGAPAAQGSLAEVHALAARGNTIEAIKRYRELTGVGLKEAKDYVDRL